MLSIQWVCFIICKHAETFANKLIKVSTKCFQTCRIAKYLDHVSGVMVIMSILTSISVLTFI